MYTFHKTELEKLVHAAPWKEREGRNSTSHAADHLPLCTDQTACVEIRAGMLQLGSQEVLFST